MQTKRPGIGQKKTSDAGPPDEILRLSKLMAEKGLCSRREADAFIAQGLVFVNGQRIDELGTKVRRDSQIELAALAQKKQDSLVTIILNKPIGYVSSQPEPGYEPAIRLLTMDNYDGPQKPDINPQSLDKLAVTGRLDIDSQGLLIFTQDGRLAKQIIGEDGKVEKEYLVRVRMHDGSRLPQQSLELLRYGLELDGKKLKPAIVEWVNEDQLRFVLTEGKKRQVRRMCELVGLEVHGLKRVRVGKLMLGKLPEGKWRFLGAHEEI